MTASPLLPPGMARRMAENEATRYPERRGPPRPSGRGDLGPRPGGPSALSSSTRCFHGSLLSAHRAIPFMPLPPS